jgi:hypothetical protein
LRTGLKRCGLELNLPHRRDRKKPKTQGGRKLRRYRRRWKVKCTFAWFSNFRLVVVRWVRPLKMYLPFFHLACLLITVNRF